MLKTKIIATLGPACDSKPMIEEMIRLGVSVFRFNTKHGDLKWHGDRINRVRQVAKKMAVPVAILLDLRGPELRVGTFPGGGIQLKEGNLVYYVDKPCDDGKSIFIPELKLIQDLVPGNAIYMDDGYLETQIVKVDKSGGRVKARVVEGGFLKNNKGINFPASDVDLPSLIKKDLEFISMPAQKDIDFLGYSFVRDRKDMLAMRAAIKKQGLKAKIIAKIETNQAIENFEEILSEADGIMVARGDLGIEISLEKVPFYQKMIITRCREAGKPVIVATHMLESMTQKPRPTRAETADVANAVYDATDAVMLSGETAGGLFPLKSVKTMTQIAGFIEDKREVPGIDFTPNNLTEMIAFSAYKLIKTKHRGGFMEQLKIKCFVVFTDTGATARYLSRLRPPIPILAITDDLQVRDQLCLTYGVKPIFFRFPEGEIRSTKTALLYLKQKKWVRKGDKVVVIYGKQWGVPGGTNTIRVEEVQ